MQKADFKIGLHIRHEDNEGKIAFISDDYITITVSEKPSHCPNSLHPTTKVNLLVFNHQWKDCELVTNTNEGTISTVSIYKAQQHRYADVQ